MTINQALNRVTDNLSKTSSSPALDSEVILSFVLKKSKEFLFANVNYRLSSLQATRYSLLATRRSRGEPIAYLTGHKEFYGLDFRVTPDVLIPRPETELLVELALDRIRNIELRIKNIIDVGTGSGCVMISLAKKIPPQACPPRCAWRGRGGGSGRGRIRIYATDISNPALKIARLNARHHGVARKIKFVQGNLLDPFLHLPLMRGRKSRGHSLILANLPYITPRKLNNPDLKFEPPSALIGGPDGLKYYRALFEQIQNSPFPLFSKRGGAPSLWQREGWDEFILLLEHDPSQVSKLKSLAKTYFPSPTKITFHRDLSGRNRVMEIS